MKIHSQVHDGEHEKGLWVDTKNIPGIMGFAKVMEIAGKNRETETHRERSLLDRLEKGVLERILGCSRTDTGEKADRYFI